MVMLFPAMSQPWGTDHVWFALLLVMGFALTPGLSIEWIFGVMAGRTGGICRP